MTVRTNRNHSHSPLSPPGTPISSPTSCDAGRPESAVGAWRVVVAGVLILTVALGQLYIVLPMLDSLALLPGASASTTTWAVTAFALPYAAGFLVLGPLTDRFGARAMMIASVSTVLAGTIFTAVAPNWGLFLVGRVVQGFAAASFTPAILVFTQTRVAPARRLVTTSAIVSAGMASAVIAQVFAQLALPALGTTGTFGLSAVALAGCLILIVALFPRPQHSASASSTPGRTVAAYRAMLRLLARPRLVLLLLAALTYLTMFVGLYAALQLTGITQDATELLMLRVSALPAIAAIPVLIPLLVRVPGRTRLLVSLAVAAAATGLLGALALAGLLTLPLFALGMLLTAGAIAVAAPATVTEVMAAAPGVGGAANALYSAAIFGGASIGTPLAALVVSLAGTGATGLGAFAVTCAVLLTLAIIIATAALRPARSRA